MLWGALKREQKEQRRQLRVIWVLATHACQKRRDNSPSRVPLIRRRRRAAGRSDEFYNLPANRRMETITLVLLFRVARCLNLDISTKCIIHKKVSWHFWCFFFNEVRSEGNWER